MSNVLFKEWKRCGGPGGQHMGHVQPDQYTIRRSGCEKQIIAQKVQKTLNKSPLELFVCKCELHRYKSFNCLLFFVKSYTTRIILFQDEIVLFLVGFLSSVIKRLCSLRAIEWFFYEQMYDSQHNLCIQRGRDEKTRATRAGSRSAYHDYNVISGVGVWCHVEGKVYDKTVPGVKTALVARI